MTKRSFRYRSDFPYLVEADLSWIPCRDGLCVTGGTLPGNGFTWGHGITVPEEIDGTPVTELSASWNTALDYIDGPSLKRVTLRLTHTPSLFHHHDSALKFGSSAPDIRIQEDGFRRCPNLETVSLHPGPLDPENSPVHRHPGLLRLPLHEAHSGPALCDGAGGSRLSAPIPDCASGAFPDAKRRPFPGGRTSAFFAYLPDGIRDSFRYTPPPHG